MRITLDDLPGHVGEIALRLPDGSLSTTGETSEPAVGYRAVCTCGWEADRDVPTGDTGRMSAESDWVAHMKPLWTAAPPRWLLNRSESLRAALSELTDSWPLQALGVLKEIDRWQRELTERTVAAARRSGHSWSEIGDALDVTKQSAHGRFKDVGE